MQKECGYCNNLFGENYYPSRLKKQTYCSYKCRSNAYKKQVLKVCQQCHKEFYTKKCWVKRGQGKFCSKVCFDKYQTIYPIRYCKTCNKPFRTCGKNRRFCSLKCAYGHRDRDVNKTGKWFICKNCGKRFYVEKRNIKKGYKNYCSLDCRRKHEWMPKRIQKKCFNCGKEFKALKLERKISKFCSFRCYRVYKGESSIEKIFRKELERRNISFKQEVQIKNFSIDFIIGNVAVECDGNYWHSKKGVKERDERKNEFLKKRGFTVLRFSENEIKKNIKDCVSKVVHEGF